MEKNRTHIHTRNRTHTQKKLENERKIEEKWVLNYFMTLFANSILRYYEHIYGYENKTETACVDRSAKRPKESGGIKSQPKGKRKTERNKKNYQPKEKWHIKPDSRV